MRTSPPRVIFLALFAAWLHTGAAWAQEDVESILRRGIALRTGGRDEDALVEFRRAYELVRSPVAAGQLGLCEQALGRWIDAERHLRESLAATDDDWVRRNRAVLEAAYAANAQRVGQLELRGDVAGAEVRIDGAPAGTLPLAEPLRVLVGTVTLEVHADGHYDISRRVVIEPGITREQVELRPRAQASDDVTPPPPAAPPTTPPVVPIARTEPRRDPLRIAGWVGLGAALAAGTLGLVALGVRESAARSFNTSCPATPPSHSPRCADLLDTGDTMATLAIVSGSVGGVLLVASAVALLLPTERASARAQWRCLPTLDGRGAACEWRF